MITRMVLGHKLPVSIANGIDTGSEQNYWLASQPTNRTRDVVSTYISGYTYRYGVGG